MTAEKKRFKSIIIEEAKYYTHYTPKFENRKKWTSPNIKEVKAFIPGTIVKISVKEGKKVKKGDTLFILEAMKMRNKVVAPITGIIKKVYVKKNDKVPKEKVMLEFE